MLRIYTTRPDTLFGATYMVIAPEHPFVERLSTPEQAEAVRAYCEKATRKSDLDRTDLAKDKTGVFTGSYAINPVTGRPIPIWVADYVLISYGTGAIMAVPAHDERDFEFAKKFDLPITPVVMPDEAWLKPTQSIPCSGPRAGKPGRGAELRSQYFENVATLREAFTGEGHAVNSGAYDGLPTAEFKQRIAADLAAKGLGRAAVNYKLRDWLFSRQHFWGEPFPILRELDEHGQPNGRLRALKPEDLPLDLPEMMKFDAAHDRPEPPLDKAPDSWLYVTLDGKRYKRETNTMPQWAGSCWYYLRFLDPKNDKALVDPELEKAWMPVDLYVGGAEHAVLHLLYAAVLAQGALRPRLREHDGAVPQAGQPGHDPGRERREDVQGPRQRGQSRPGRQGIRGRRAAAVRDVHGPAGGRQALEHGRRQRRRRFSRSRLANDHRRAGRRDAAQRGGGRYRADGRAEPRAAQDDPGGDAGHRANVVQYGHRADDGVHELLLQGPASGRRR